MEGIQFARTETGPHNNETALLARKIAELEAQNEALKEENQLLRRQSDAYKAEARTDALTGAANRKGFDEMYSELFATFAHNPEQHEKKELPQDFAILALDLDGFKDMNDMFGHGEGDARLQEVTAAITESIREESDALVARPGGDEFFVLLPHTNAAQAQIIAERIRTSVRGVGDTFRAHNTERIAHVEQTTGKTFRGLATSIGVATFAETRDAQLGNITQESLRTIADDALYRAKAYKKSLSQTDSFTGAIKSANPFAGTLPNKQ